MILGNFIFNYVVNRVLAENHPTKDYDRCINRRQVKHICTVCQERSEERRVGKECRL